MYDLFQSLFTVKIIERRIKPVKNIFLNVISEAMVSVTTTTSGGPPGMTDGR